MFSVVIEDRGFTDAILKAVGLSAKDFAPEYRRLGDQLVGEVKDQFTVERDPYGNPWVPLKFVTVVAKTERGSSNPTKILEDTGRLKDSFQWEVMPEGLSVYTDRVFPDGVTAEIHQFGGLQPRSRAFVPSREMLPFRENLPVGWLSWVEVYHDIGIDRIFK